LLRQNCGAHGRLRLRSGRIVQWRRLMWGRRDASRHSRGKTTADCEAAGYGSSSGDATLPGAPAGVTATDCKAGSGAPGRLDAPQAAARALGE
jgi:hypothetical protein